MKATKKLTWIALSAAVFLILSGCSHPRSPKMVHEIRFSLEGITDITISYDEESIAFYQTGEDELIIKEYMTADKDSYYARTKKAGSSIQVSEGGKPLFPKNFARRIEVYLPASYREALTVTTTDGNIDMGSAALQFSQLCIDSTAGMIDLGSITAPRIQLSTTSGTLSCEALNGHVEYDSTSGNAIIKTATGSGSYRANNSGSLIVCYTEVNGDLYLYNKNGNIELTLPQALPFFFEGETKNGSLSTPFQDKITVDGRTARGTIGTNPTVTIKTETTNGIIEIKQ